MKILKPPAASLVFSVMAAITTYHPKRSRILNMQKRLCTILFLYENIAINDIGQVTSRMANSAHTEKSWTPSGRTIHRLYIVELPPSAFPAVNCPNGRHRHTIAEITASNKNNVCLRCIITLLLRCPSACRASIRCRQETLVSPGA